MKLPATPPIARSEKTEGKLVDEPTELYNLIARLVKGLYRYEGSFLSKTPARRALRHLDIKTTKP